MKEIRSKKGSKQIIIIIVMIMLCNFIVPNYSYAADTKNGGELFKDLAQLLCFIPDVAVNFLQNMFVTSQEIKISDEEYKILYSPGTIFAGQIPAFDINFITANKDNNVLAQNEDLKGINSDNADEYIKANEEKYRAGQTITKSEYDEKLKELQEKKVYNAPISGAYDYNHTSPISRIEYEIYYYIDDNSTEKLEDDVLVIETFGRYGTKFFNSLAAVRSYYHHVYTENFYNIDEEYKSTAFILQDTIAVKPSLTSSPDSTSSFLNKPLFLP